MRYQEHTTFYDHPTDGVVQVFNVAPVFDGNDGLYRAVTPDGAQILVTATRLRQSPATEEELEEDSNA